VQVHKRIAKPKQLILGDDGNTLYIGNRESDSFWRIYDKTEEHTRCEVELKGNRAKGAWRFLVNNPNDLAQLYSGLLKKSRVPKFLVDYYQHAVQPTDLAQLKTELPEDMEKKLQWLTTLDSLVYKLANDHDMSDRTHVLIKRWYEYCSKP
jgi:DNA relaxase NicK